MASLSEKVKTTHKRAAVDVARSYISAGIPVFPCREENQEGFDQSTGEFVTFSEKSPYTSNGLKGATRSSRIIDILFGDKHQGALIGVPTGEPLGAWVLDLDRHGDRDGHKWLAEMESVHGALPPTARATTANGGTHIFFKHIDGIRNRGALAPGVDTRGQGGYICGPGSVMSDGRAYKWVDHDGVGMPEFADTPQWLLDILKPRVEQAEVRTEYTYKPGRNEAYIERAVQLELDKLAATGAGGRGGQVNASAFSLGQLVGAGALSRSEAEYGLLQAAHACGIVQKDGEKEIRQKIKRGLDAGEKQPRVIPEPEYSNDDTTPVSMDKIRGMIEKTIARQDAEKDGAKTEPSSPTAGNDKTPPSDPKKRERFELTWFDEIKEGEPKEMFIKGAFGVREFTTISGLPGTGKSVITTDAACHVAAGMEWHGRKVKKGLVVYVAAERKKLTERRMMAFRKKHGVKDVPLLVLGGRLDFTKDLKDAKDLIAAIKNAETETEMQCVWVIVDTLTRVFGAGDQNASKDMSRFVDACYEVLTETTAHVTAIHHSAWSGERGKGAIDLDGAVDASFMVKKDHGKYKLICDGTNDGEEGTILSFDMESITIGHDEEGEPTTAPVVVASAEPKPPTSGSLKGYKGEVLSALKSAIDKNGFEPNEPHFPENVAVVDEKTWRDEFYSTRDMANTSQGETAKKQFQRAPEALIKEGHVIRQGVWYWAA